MNTCPLCQSAKVIQIEPDAAQVAIGVTCVLRCDCGAEIALSNRPTGKDESQESVETLSG